MTVTNGMEPIVTRICSVSAIRAVRLGIFRVRESAFYSNKKTHSRDSGKHWRTVASFQVHNVEMRLPKTILRKTISTNSMAILPKMMIASMTIKTTQTTIQIVATAHQVAEWRK